MSLAVYPNLYHNSRWVNNIIIVRTDSIISRANTIIWNRPDQENLDDHKIELAVQKHAGESCVCSLCLEDIEKDIEVHVLPCGHEFHAAKCMNGKNILDWINEHRTCPYCRALARPITPALSHRENMG